MASTVELLLLSQLALTVNPPIALLYQTTAQSIPAGTSNTALTWNLAQVDTYNGFSTSHPTRYTCQQPGWYDASATVAMASGSAGTMYAAWQVNGNPPVNTPNTETGPVTGSHNRAAGISGLVFLNAGDYLEVITWQDSGSAISTSTSPSSSLSIRWRHP